MAKKTILLADEDKELLKRLRALLSKEFKVLGAATDGKTLVSMARDLKPQAVVADVRLPLVNGIQAIRRIRKQNPDVCVVFLTDREEARYAVRAAQAGASGYVMKDSAADQLARAVHDALCGRMFVSPCLEFRIKNAPGKPALQG
ncbi:MAG: response regulator transcription factor [Thermodesulfobacteriota bacterium]